MKKFNYSLLASVVCLLLCGVPITQGLKCWTCDNADGLEDCDKNGKLEQCNGVQNTCGIEVRHNGGWQLSSHIKVFKFCKQSPACDNVQNQNGKRAWNDVQCNPKFPNSVCRCCCQSDNCNYGTIDCMDMKEPQNCFPELSSPKHGHVGCSNGSNVGSRCDFECEQGYYLSGKIRSTCENSVKTMRWSSSPPTCQPITCPALPNIENGSYKCNKFAFLGSACSFTCNKGFKLVGPKKSICEEDTNKQSTGRWDTNGQICEPQECKNLPQKPSNGFVHCTNARMIGSICSFGCNRGFEIVGKEAIECSQKGMNINWSGEEPSCKRIECTTELRAPTHGYKTCTDEQFVDSICEFFCLEDFERSGPQYSTCTEDKKWDNKVPACKRRECSKMPSVPVNGVMQCSDSKFIKSVCEFVCAEGHDLVGSTETLCSSGYNYGDSTPNWTEDEPTCERKRCDSAPTTPTNGNMKCSDEVFLGSVCKFGCKEGFDRVGAMKTTCMHHKGKKPDWNNDAPVCKRKQCSNRPNAPTNGAIKCTDQEFLGSVCEFSCDLGHYRAGYQYSTCMEDYDTEELVWDNVTPTCEKMECTYAPRAPTNGFMTCTDKKFMGSVCSFECGHYYDIVGIQYITCIDDDVTGQPQWDNRAPTCIRKECARMPEEPINGDMVCSDRKFYGSVCAFSCDEGYKRVGGLYTTCEASKKKIGQGKPTWDMQSPICKRKRCFGKPTAPSNGFIVCNDSDYFGSQCEYGCDAHYRRVGPLYTTCGKGEFGHTEWSSQKETVCERITCPKLENIRHGNMKCSDEGFVNSECEFSCTVEDYKLSPIGRQSITCQNDTTWSKNPPCCARSCPPYAVMDLVVLLDSSSTIGESSWKIMLKFVNSIFGLFRVQHDATNFAVVRYNKKIDSDTQINLNDCPDDVDRLKKLVGEIPYNGSGTRTGQAIKYAHEKMLVPENGDRNNVTNVVLVITDGRSQDDVKKPSYALRKDGVLTFALGITPSNPKLKLDMDQLADIAGADSRLFLAKDGFDTLTPEFAAEISENICGDPCEHQVL